MSLYQYFTSNCDSVCKAYDRPSDTKREIEEDILFEMNHMVGGRRYRVLGHSPQFFTCAYLYTGEDGHDVFRRITKWNTYDTVITGIFPNVFPVLGEDGLRTGKYKMDLLIKYDGGEITIPYHELADDMKALFSTYIREYGMPIR